MKNILVISVILTLMYGCDRKPSRQAVNMSSYSSFEDEEIMITKPELSRSAQSKDPGKVTIQVDKQKIIKNGNIGLKVTNIEKSKIYIDSLVKHYKGYYGNESFNNTDYSSGYNLKIRVPSVNLERLISDIENGSSEILFKEINARDVTEEFIDLETRLNSKRNYLERYNELLKQAKTIKDILEIQEKTRIIEEEIESTEGRLRYLSDQVTYSTLDLSISKDKDYRFKPGKRHKFSERLKQSLSKGWFGLVDFVLFMIRIWPLMIIIIVLVIFRDKIKIRKKKKN